ncbi:O-acyltransferase like protein-like [Leptidea sinapis]|uniref:O-acyltransferase like protein-like n=1 Tax=Leptidea sinapis TaxID=189913 RepID=UPI0021C3EEE3|nr:O-acyltransferase like protein-like [Leptidea sinapis]
MSIVNWLSDGPDWPKLAYATGVCKQRWWAALLHVQNYLKPNACLYQTWYLTVDTQLYMLSPLVLIFLYLKIPKIYMRKFYAHTPARAAPYVIGIMYGYILKTYRGKTIQLQKKFILPIWICALVAMAFCVFAPNETLSENYYVPHFFDQFLSSYLRSMWAASVGWVILACTHGFGGPIEWFLSLTIWKLPSRMSYAVYLVHLPVIMIRTNGMLKSEYFTDLETIYAASSYAFISMLVAFALCVVIDAPCSTLQKAAFVPSQTSKKVNGANVQEKDNKTRL